MIKPLKKYEIQLNPFQSTYEWELNNTNNLALLLFESTGSDDGTPYAVEFIDYGLTSSFENTNCDIALEQQTNGNVITIDYGLNVSGLFYPDTDPQNIDGTYQRMIYTQIKSMFYNKYKNPAEIWGLENIDFDLSQTQRILYDKFRIIYIPQESFGDKIIPNTVKLIDNTTDNYYTISDDGNGNLIAGTNLFSNQQEVGNYSNNFSPSMSSSYCDYYWNN